MDGFKFLFHNVTELRGVGEKLSSALARLNIYRIKDLLLYKPLNIEIKQNYEPDTKIEPGITYIIPVEIIEIPPINEFRKLSKFRYIIKGKSFNRPIGITFFNFLPYHIVNNLKKGQEYIFVGKLGFFNNQLQLTHPEFYKPEQLNIINKYDPKYSLTYAITSKQISNLIEQCLVKFTELPEWLPIRIIKNRELPDFLTAVKVIHYLEEASNSEHAKAMERLALDELLAHNLMLLISKSHSTLKKTPLKLNIELFEKIKRNLSFKLTSAQEKALKEIEQELASNKLMFRLLQGDVGSGKTIIAILASALVSNEGQSVIMVPTDILASQHYETFKNTLEPFGIKVGLLKSAMPGKLKQETLKQCESGEIQVIVGTHSVIQEDVKFANLKLAVIDEQHRFGVKQRLALSEKGQMVNILLMTATPIPRTLLLANYGEIDVSLVNEKPVGRKQIITKTVSNQRINEVITSIRGFLEKKEKIYWICPLVEESENVEHLVSVTERYDYLKKIFGLNVGLVHGQMSNAEKNEVMEKFAFTNEVNILVATTVVEVGVNVPKATCIVIENSERFGLAQLHQLRGRVGRSDLQSYCILLFSEHISFVGKKRLQAMRDSNDGFYLSEQDLELRGGGDILGTRQSGELFFKLAEFPRDTENLEIAGNLANNLHQTMKDEIYKENNPVNVLLKIFDYEECMEYKKG